ncbi:MAG: hypothetical protein IMF11_19020 [Proteobacteria bacterium]|nr:hypothetical protein [Pseudomonadota bacterium]
MIITNIKNLLKKWIKGDLRDLYWNIYGVTIRNPRRTGHPESFLFVCKGNINRSPFAEHLAGKLVGNTLIEEATFYSGGLNVSRSTPPPKEAILAAESFGVQLNGHRSRGINREMIESFDMIVAMETWQLQALKKSFPKYKDKAYLLPLFDTQEGAKRHGFSRYNIQDPYGRSLDEFRVCFQRIKRCIEGLFEEIERQ